MRDDTTHLQDILNAIDAAQTFVAGMDRGAFERDQRTQYAVTHALQIIGEATKRLPDTLRNRHTGVPWRLMAGMRDRLIHGYDTVDLNVLWKTIQEDLPATRTLIVDVLLQEQSDPE